METKLYLLKGNYENSFMENLRRKFREHPTREKGERRRRQSQLLFRYLHYYETVINTKFEQVPYEGFIT